MLGDSRALAESSLIDWRRDVRIALAGPLVNILLAFASAAVISTVEPSVRLWDWPFLGTNNLLRSVVWSNLYLCLQFLARLSYGWGARATRALLAKFGSGARHAPGSPHRPIVCRCFHPGRIALEYLADHGWLLPLSGRPA